VEVGSATLGLPVVKQVLFNNLEILEGGGEGGPHIVAPVSGAIADHGTLQVDVRKAIVE